MPSVEKRDAMSNTTINDKNCELNIYYVIVLVGFLINIYYFNKSTNFIYKIRKSLSELNENYKFYLYIYK